VRSTLDVLALGCSAVAVAGCLHALFAAWLLHGRRGGKIVEAPPSDEAVTVLKPLHGAEPGLYEHLASFCDQAHAGPLQILLGVQDPRDPAAAVAERLRSAYPGIDIELCVGARGAARNPKIANLAGMQPRIRHAVLVVSDSDIAVGRDYLARTLAALARPNTGSVTWLYRGVARSGLWARLGSMAINHQFLPNVLVGLKLRLAHPCFGSTIALKRATLESIGGFEAFSDCLADDYEIGRAIRATGLHVAIADGLVSHACNEHSVQELFRHELRWARTIRGIDPFGYAGSAVTYPLAFALAALALNAGTVAAALVAAVLACRIVLVAQADRWTGERSAAWLVPVRELVSFLVFAASHFVSAVSWRGRRLGVRADGTLQPSGRPTR